MLDRHKQWTDEPYSEQREMPSVKRPAADVRPGNY